MMRASTTQTDVERWKKRPAIGQKPAPSLEVQRVCKYMRE
jgi:hypothetical protein